MTDYRMGLGECDCPEARLLRRLVEILNSPGEMLDRLASTLAVWKLRSMAHELSGARDWTQAPLSWAKRQEYDTAAESAEEIHARVSASWEAWYRARDTEWLTTCAAHSSADTPHGRLVVRILRERS